MFCYQESFFGQNTGGSSPQRHSQGLSMNAVEASVGWLYQRGTQQVCAASASHSPWWCLSPEGFWCQREGWGLRSAGVSPCSSPAMCP